MITALLLTFAVLAIAFPMYLWRARRAAADSQRISNEGIAKLEKEMEDLLK